MSDPDLVQRTVLIVDDNPGALKVFRLAIEADGYRVLAASDGQEAIAHLNREPVGFVIQDFLLPDMEGGELLRRLRALPYGRELAVVVVSGFKTLLSQAHCGPDGFNAALLKPVQLSTLLETVHRYLPLQPTAEPPQAHPHTVLVVDDDPVQLKLSRLRLEHAGFRVLTAADGETAIAAAAAQIPDVVLCDVLMPGIDGYELCVRLRTTPALAAVPVVLVSAYYNGARDQELASKVGATELVLRTPELDGVIECLRRAVSAPAVVGSVANLPQGQHQHRVTAQLMRQAKANAELATRSTLQAAQLAILAGIAEALTRSHKIDWALADVLTTCLDAGGISRGAQYRINRAGQLVLIHAIGFPDAAKTALSDAFDCSEKVVHAAPHTVISLRACLPPSEASRLLSVGGVNNAVFIPLLEYSSCTGALLLGSDSKEMSEQDLLTFGRAIAAQIAQASVLAEAFTRLRESEQAGRVLAGSLDLEQLLTSFGGLATARLADVCGVQLGTMEPRIFTSEHVQAQPALDTSPRAHCVENEILLSLEAQGQVLGTVTLSRAPSGRTFSLSDRDSAEDLVRRAAVAIANAQSYQAAKDASHLKDEFLATVSHELRTPLNAILGWARMLTSGLAVSKREQAYRVIERNAIAQAHLIDDLLDMSRIISGKMRLQARRTNLARILHAALESAMPAMEMKNIELTTAIPPTYVAVLADPDRLQQVVWNLFSNAIRFTPKGGRIDVSLLESEGHVLLSVADSGEGIDASFIASVFDRFRQADGAITRSHGGLGLGLAISRHLVELHGGSITAHSDGKGQGARFTVELPSCAASDRVGSKSTPPPDMLPKVLPDHDFDGLCILVVDDDPDARELILTTLEECGARVTEAASAAEALTSLRMHRPDILLSDIGMPGQDGFALIRTLRALPSDQGGSVPAAAITAYARDEDRVQTLAAGFQLHVAKPVDPNQLISAVAKLRTMCPLAMDR